MTVRDELIARRDRVEARIAEDDAKREAGARYPDAMSAYGREREREQLEELRLICELLADASECFGP